MVKSRSAYKQLIRRKRYQYDKKQTQNLRMHVLKMPRIIGNYQRGRHIINEAVYMLHILKSILEQ